MTKLLTTDAWVAKLNALGRKLDEWTNVLHPSVWEEQLGDMMQEYRELAAQPTFDPPEQLPLPLWEES